jgi:hypothetical protein
MIPLGTQQKYVQFLYGFVCVFPWVLDILRQARCLMTDTTFKSLRPYTLSILLAIIANESVPIAFSVSPTETTGSYARIFDLIDEIIANPHSVSERAAIA